MTEFQNRDLITPLGEFEIKSDVVWVTDPCYERGTWCQAKFENEFKKGTWLAFLTFFRDDLPGCGDSKKRYNVHDLIAVHSSVLWELSQFRYLSQNQPDKVYLDAASKAKQKGVKYQGSDIGVDSGSVGIFCDTVFDPPPKNSKRGSPEERWYESIGEVRLAKKMGAMSDHGLEAMLGMPALNVEGGVVPGGCVTGTAYGDGSVDMYITRDAENKIVKVVLDSAFSDHTEDDE